MVANGARLKISFKSSGTFVIKTSSQSGPKSNMLLGWLKKQFSISPNSSVVHSSDHKTVLEQ